MAPLTLTVPSGYGVPGATVLYNEAPSSPVEGVASGSGCTATRTFVVPWSQRWQFVAGMVGWTYLKRTSDTWWNARVTPQSYALRDLDPSEAQTLYAMGVESMKGEGKVIGYDSLGTAQYLKARVNIAYRSPTYRIYSDDFLLGGGLNSPDPITGNTRAPLLHEGGGVDESYLVRYVTKYRRPTAEYLTLPYGALKWVQQNPIQTPTGSILRIVSSMELKYTWHRVCNVPDTTQRTIGHLNNSQFDGCPRGTLLLTAVETTPYRWFFNQRLWDITYTFKFFSPIGSSQEIKNGGPIQVQNPSTGLWYDLRPDSKNIPVREYLGHNHYLRVNPGDPNGPGVVNGGYNLAPTYQMLTSDGVAPYGNFDPPPQGVTFQRPGVYNSNNFIGLGETIYRYTNFQDLFTSSRPVTPSE